MERRETQERRVAHRGGRRRMDHRGRPLVLIVDDHVDSRELLAAVLLDVGVAIAEAGTGSEAIARATGDPRPSLILIDLALPDCHGTEVVRTLKGRADTRDIPIVALSASVMAADKEAAALAGCLAFIEKPLLPDTVIDMVKRLLASTGV